MSSEQRDRLALPGQGPTDEDLRHEIELTRQELGDTVAELAYKMDVKSRTREAAQRKLAQVHEVTASATESVRRHRLVVGAGVLATVALLVILRIRR
jgi:hypothetical protein